MTIVSGNRSLSNVAAGNRWLELADRVLAALPKGTVPFSSNENWDSPPLSPVLSEEEGLAVLRSGDDQLLEVLAAAYRVRYRRSGNRVRLNVLINAKSGLCGEDCGYCSQSRVSQAEIPQYPLVDAQHILDGARQAAERRAKTYCIVVSGRSLADRELDCIAEIVPRIKADHALRICVSPGLLTLKQARRLKACGVDRVNHNLNTSARFYARICTTHRYQDRLDTLEAVRQAGMEICSGGIVGMGEEHADVVELALRLGRLRADAVPLNFFQPIAGTPLAGDLEGDSPIFAARKSGQSPARKSGQSPARKSGQSPARKSGQSPARKSGQSPSCCSADAKLDPRYCLKVLALFRLANPQGELRIAAGREMHLGSLQPLGLYAADSIFVGDYLTTKGQTPEEDYRMIADLGFEVAEE